jgi:dienelactone hydrolase
MAQNTDQKIEEMSADFLKHLQKAEYNDAANFFDNSLKIDGAKLQDVWTKLNGQLGAIQRTEPSYVERANEVRTVFTPIAFERASLDMKLSFNSSDKVVGFFFAPHVNHDPYVVPAYVNMNAVTEKPLNIETGQFTLSGKLALPKNTTAKAPVVILVHGSGPNDMDEGIGPNKVFKDLALGLATDGIATIRYDKRTKVYGAQMAQIKDLTVMQETIEDVVSAVKLAEQLPEIDSTRIYVLGHSLGAMLAPRIAQMLPELRGIILMAAPADKTEDLVVAQYTYLASLHGTLSDTAKRELDEIKKKAQNAKTATATSNSSDLLFNLPASYWMDLNKYDQVQTAKKLPIRILVLQGERDYQVPMTEYNLWKKALGKNKNVNLISYPKLNHLFIGGVGKSSPEEYEKQGSVSAQPITDIANWIKSK